MKINFDNYIRRTLLVTGLCVYVMFSTSPALAQRGVSQELDSIEAIYNIRYEMPKGFNDLDTIQIWTPVGNYGRFGGLYWVFESKDKQCKVLYGLPPASVIDVGSRIDKGLKYIYETEDAVRDKYLHTLSLKEARESFNADSVFLYDVPTAKPQRRDEKCIHCTQMLIFRRNCLLLEFIWCFTDKGKEKKEKYMRKINKRIWFNDGKGDINDQTSRGEEWLLNYLKHKNWGNHY